MKIKELIKKLQEGIKLNPECEIFMDDESEPYVSYDDLGNCVIYGVDK